MKKSLVLFLLLFSASFAQQSIVIPDRPIGSGTFVTITVNGTTGYSPITGQPLYLNGFQMTVDQNYSPFTPIGFDLGTIFYQNNWIYTYHINNSVLSIAAVGNPMFLSNDEVSTLRLFINESSGMYNLSEVSFFDGTTNWIIGSSSFHIIQLPQWRYTDENNDGQINIADAIIMWNIVGNTNSTNDTVLVISDPSGDGKILTWDVNLILQKIVDPSFVYPIFSNYGCGYGKEKVVITWRLLNNGKYGAFSDEKITNGDLTGTGLSQSGSGWFKKVQNNVYFINNNSITEPFLIADYPVPLTGTVNEGRQVIVSTSLTGIEEEKSVPIKFSLEQNYPNPFNPTTTISYQISVPGFVTLKVYDVLGKEVATLVNEEKNAGNYSIQFNAATLPSGTYMYRLSANNFIQTKKMILMK